MAGQYSRQTPLEGTREPHSVSLKVLKLARPGLTQQFPFPSSTEQLIDSRASLAYPSSSEKSFILSPLLSLPRGPAAAFVGEIFSTLICVNNELSPDNTDREVSSLKVEAEMQTPTHTEPLEIIYNDRSIGDEGLKPGETAQRTVKFDLREDGVHVLSITITYSERFTLKGESSASGGRVRTFKKLYNLNAAPCLSVRTKASLVRRGQGENYALEAQLENLADGLITLEEVTFEPKPYYRSTGLNWNVAQRKHDPPSLSPREVTQVMFHLEETEAQAQKEVTPDGRTKLGYLSVRWRGAMGEPGFLSTGELASRRR